MQENIGPYPRNEFIQLWLDKWHEVVEPSRDMLLIQISEIDCLTTTRDSLNALIGNLEHLKPDSDYSNAAEKLVSFWQEIIVQRRNDLQTTKTVYRDVRSTVLSMLKAAGYDTSELELLDDPPETISEIEQ